MMLARRILLFILLAVTVAAGLASRKYDIGPKQVGDALWSMAIYFLLAGLIPWWPKVKVAIITLGFSYAIEFSQLYHAPWIDHLREYYVGKLVLGSTFIPLDLLAYTIGVIACVLIDPGPKWRRAKS